MNQQIQIIVAFATCFFAIISSLCDASRAIATTPYIVHDKILTIKPTNQHGLVTVATTVPDWSDVNTYGKARYIETLLIADIGVSKRFNRDMKKLRRAVVTLMQALNLYLYQLDIRLIVVDVVEMIAHNVTLERFAGYKREKFHEFPAHDLAILISSTYEGGIAYVNGICGRSAVGIIGFFADAPMEYASIFFHELAHLLGLSHDAKSDCSCRQTSLDSDEGCLKIDGFDNDCSVQALIEKLDDHVCIESPPVNLPKTTLPICGNQFIEEGEECDCGPERFCKSLICNPVTCKRTISDLQLLCILTVVTAASSIILYTFCKCREAPKAAQVFAETDIGINNKVWDTPTFMPLVNSSSADCSQIHQMWNATATMLTENTSIFSSPESSPNKQFATMPTNSASNRNSILPPIPPRAADYVNIISPAKSVDNILLRSPPPPSFTSSVPRTTQTLGRPVPRPKILITRRPSQCPLLLQSPVRPPPLVPQSESLSNINYQVPYRDRHQNDNELPQLHELNGYTLSNKLNQSPHRLIFSTESSQEIPTVCTSNVQNASPPRNVLDNYIQLPRTPEKERQHQELIDALSEILKSEEEFNARRKAMANQSSSLNQLYPILPTSDSSYATMPSSSCNERIYDAIWTPTKVSDYQTNNMEFQSAPKHTEFMPTDENHHEHLVRLSFSPPHRSTTTRRSRGKRSKFSWSRSLSRTSARSSENPSATPVMSCNEATSRLRLSSRDAVNSRPSVPPPPPPPPPPPHFSLTPLISE